jgi:hypothetical protein
MTEQHCTGCSGADYLGRPCRDLVSQKHKADAARLAEALKWQHSDGHTGGCVFSGDPPRCRTVEALDLHDEATK